MRPTLLYSPLSPFHWPQNTWPWNLEWPFYVEFSLLRTAFQQLGYIFTVESVYIHVTSGDVRTRSSGPWSAEYFESAEKNCGSFVDATSWELGTLTNKANISIYYYLVPYRHSTNSKTHDHLEWPFCVKFCFVPVCLELRSLAFEAWLL